MDIVVNWIAACSNFCIYKFLTASKTPVHSYQCISLEIHLSNTLTNHYQSLSRNTHTNCLNTTDCYYWYVVIYNVIVPLIFETATQ